MIDDKITPKDQQPPLSPEEQLYLRQQLFTLLARQTKAYTAGDSSSVPIEIAGELLHSICFTLHILPEEASSYRPLLHQDLGALLSAGMQELQRKMEDSKTLWTALCTHLPPVTNIAMTDTLKSIGTFWKRYDYRFFAHEIPCDIDYQLSQPVPEQLQGIDYVHEYLKRMAIENDFLRLFREEAVIPLLRAYCPDYNGLLINLYEPVVTNAAGLALLQKEVTPLSISPDDRSRLHQLFFPMTQNEIRDTLSWGADQLAKALHIHTPAAKEYLRTCIIQLTPRILSARDHGDLSHIFLTAKT